MFTTEFTSAGDIINNTATNSNCPPLGSSHNIICMNVMHWDFNLSSKGVKFRHSAFKGKFIL